MTKNLESLSEEILSLSTKSKQMNKVIEELCELARAVSRYNNDPYNSDNVNNLFEEFVDVEVVMNELSSMLIDDYGLDKYDYMMNLWNKTKEDELKLVVEKLKLEQ